jgi:hypothetical protein
MHRQYLRSRKPYSNGCEAFINNKNPALYDARHLVACTVAVTIAAHSHAEKGPAAYLSSAAIESGELGSVNDISTAPTNDLYLV